MVIRSAFVCAVVVALPGAATAQTKISGTVHCAPPEVMHALPVDEATGHVYAISRGRCTWTKPVAIAGSNTKEDVFTSFDEIKGDEAKGHGDGQGTLENGERINIRIEGKTRLVDGLPQSGQGTWKFQGGTGALKTLTGAGSYTCVGGAEGMSCEVSGEYALPR
jgi:hypothetical protein